MIFKEFKILQSHFTSRVTFLEELRHFGSEADGFSEALLSPFQLGISFLCMSEAVGADAMVEKLRYIIPKFSATLESMSQSGWNVLPESAKPNPAPAPVLPAAALVAPAPGAPADPGSEVEETGHSEDEDSSADEDDGNIPADDHDSDY